MSKYNQIDEMAKATMKHCKIDNRCGSCHWSTCNECLAEVYINAGYRKQSEGEWIIKGLANPKCSACNSYNRCGDKSDFCPNCGAKMKGGE